MIVLRTGSVRVVIRITALILGLILLAGAGAQELRSCPHLQHGHGSDSGPIASGIGGAGAGGASVPLPGPEEDPAPCDHNPGLCHGHGSAFDEGVAMARAVLPGVRAEVTDQPIRCRRPRPSAPAFLLPYANGPPSFPV